MHFSIKKSLVNGAFILLICSLFTGCKDSQDKVGSNHDNNTAQITYAVTEKPENTHTPSPTVIPTPTLRPAYGVTTLSLYKNYNDLKQRKRVDECFEAEWITGKDIASFEAIASDEETINTNGRYFQDIWRQYWNSFDNNEECHIGYHVEFALKNGTKFSKYIYGPSATEEYFDYIENYLYDDINKVKGQWYSHITDSDVKPDMIISSIKFTAGKKVGEIEGDITLTAFVYYSKDDFDENGNYRGATSCTIKIRNISK
ncbi:MAG: hypothetical protein PUB67_05435 [Clostridiales bacterium]|nr:hypothetical protein [Clostridiales bacterium]